MKGRVWVMGMSKGGGRCMSHFRLSTGGSGWRGHTGGVKVRSLTRQEHTHSLHQGSPSLHQAILYTPYPYIYQHMDSTSEHDLVAFLN